MTPMENLKRWLCGSSHPSHVHAEDAPPDVRDASHALNNAASILHGSVSRLQKEVNALADLTTKMRGTHDG